MVTSSGKVFPIWSKQMSHLSIEEHFNHGITWLGSEHIYSDKTGCPLTVIQHPLWTLNLWWWWWWSISIVFCRHFLCAFLLRQHRRSLSFVDCLMASGWYKCCSFFCNALVGQSDCLEEQTLRQRLLLLVIAKTLTFGVHCPLQFTACERCCSVYRSIGRLWKSARWSFAFIFAFRLELWTLLRFMSLLIVLQCAMPSSL